MTNRILLVEEQCATFRDGPWRDSDFDVELIATEPTDWSEPKLIRKMGGDFWRRHRVVEYVPRQALSQSESDALERAAALVGCYDYWNDSSGPLDLAQRIRALKPPAPQGGNDGR